KVGSRVSVNLIRSVIRRSTNPIVARPSIELVVARAPGQLVIAAETLDDVITGGAGEDVRARRPGDRASPSATSGAELESSAYGDDVGVGERDLIGRRERHDDIGTRLRDGRARIARDLDDVS